MLRIAEAGPNGALASRSKLHLQGQRRISPPRKELKMKWDIISFGLGFSAGAAALQFWTGTIKPWLLREIRVVVTGGKDAVHKLVDDIKAKL